jgi:hypothetical protein
MMIFSVKKVLQKFRRNKKINNFLEGTNVIIEGLAAFLCFILTKNYIWINFHSESFQQTECNT